MSQATDNHTTLVADVGGTNVRFGLIRGDDPTPRAVDAYPCERFPGLAEAARAYLDTVAPPRPATGLMAVAAPVTGDTVHLTNNGWTVSVEETRRRIGLRGLRLVNDFVAQAMAIPVLGPEAFESLGGGPAPGMAAPLAVIGPGTGLGVASLVHCRDGWQPLGGEGGHVTYSPVSDREMALAAAVRDRYGHCSAERLLSGRGLVVLYSTLAELDGAGSGIDPRPEDITRQATEDHASRAHEAVDLFIAGLGTTAGNLALTVGAAGGVYLCGGILPRLGPLMDRALFRRRFESKGRFTDYLRAIPTFLVTAEHPALHGLGHMIRQQGTSCSGKH